MSTGLTNLDLLNKCKRFILSDPTREDLDGIIEDAIITASKEIGNLAFPLPIAWYRETYDEIFTRYYATISAVTQADPGVITADSVDPDLTSDHGFQTGDIVFIDGVYGMERLNRRFFRAVRTAATTLTLKTMDGDDAISTSDYEEYDSGGTIYHVGTVLPASTIEPTSDWKIQRIWNVTFDGYPSEPISEEEAVACNWLNQGGRPNKWRYQKYSYTTFEQDNLEHFLFWLAPVGQRYNVRIFLEKSYPDISSFTKTAYPPHLIEIHDFIWHRALSNLATHGDKARRRTANKEDTGRGDNTKMEIVSAQYWIAKALDDEITIMSFHRSLLGHIPNVNSSMGA